MLFMIICLIIFVWCFLCKFRSKFGSNSVKIRLKFGQNLIKYVFLTGQLSCFPVRNSVKIQNSPNSGRSEFFSILNPKTLVLGRSQAHTAIARQSRAMRRLQAPGSNYGCAQAHPKSFQRMHVSVPNRYSPWALGDLLDRSGGSSVSLLFPEELTYPYVRLSSPTHHSPLVMYPTAKRVLSRDQSTWDTVVMGPCPLHHGVIPLNHPNLRRCSYSTRVWWSLLAKAMPDLSMLLLVMHESASNLGIDISPPSVVVWYFRVKTFPQFI
jgi:hypothetical protein